MDPYIESCRLWEDFHQKLIGEIETALSRVLPDQYTARLGERAYISLSSGNGGDNDRHVMQGNVTIVSNKALSGPETASAVIDLPSAVSEIEAIEMISVDQYYFREPFIEIRSLAPDRPLATTIEVLSPSNKREGSDGWEQYQRKRLSHLKGAANLVEIDLLRGGRRMPMASPWPDSPYTILVSRKSQAPRCSAWRASFASPIPTIPIPLNVPDPDVMISIQPMIDAVYA